MLALRHTKEAELLPAPAVIGESVILSDQLPAASIRPCTFRLALLVFLPLIDVRPDASAADRHQTLHPSVSLGLFQHRQTIVLKAVKRLEETSQLH